MHYGSNQWIGSFKPKKNSVPGRFSLNNGKKIRNDKFNLMMQETTTENNDDDVDIDGVGSNVDSASVGKQWHPDKSQTLQNFFSPPPHVEKIFETATVTTPATIDLLENDR